MKAAKDLFTNYTTYNNGWDFIVDYKKWGWVPVNGTGAKMIMEFPHVTQPIRFVSVLYMKSYGERWKDSLLRVGMSVQASSNHNITEWKELHRDELSGTHAKNTSEMYTHERKLEEEVAIGSNLCIEMELVNGTAFKMMGLSVCS